MSVKVNEMYDRPGVPTAAVKMRKSWSSQGEDSTKRGESEVTGVGEPKLPVKRSGRRAK